LNELLVGFESCCFARKRCVLLQQYVGLVVAVKTPVVLVEASQRHQLSVVNFDRFHV